MKFCDIFHQMLEDIGCSARQLSLRSGISTSVLSRYRSGDRMPNVNSDSYLSLCQALAEFAAKKGLSDYTLPYIQEQFEQCEGMRPYDTALFSRNLDTLLDAIHVNIAQLCQTLNYDPSTISRFRNNVRSPQDLAGFLQGFTTYLCKEHMTPADLNILHEFLLLSEEELQDPEVYRQAISNYLLQNMKKEPDQVQSLLTKLNDFDLNEFTRTIHFDEIKVPSIPFQIPKHKDYYGLEGMKESELAFMKTTILSKSMEDVIMYSDMPIEEAAKDEDFAKKWMMGIAVMLKKGLHLHQIHHLDRSFREMLLGLEKWIPMYMTGQISPYYLKNTNSSYFHHFLKTSGSVALQGEAIHGHPEHVRMTLTSNKNELDYMQERARKLLEHASPLMEIYDSTRTPELLHFLEKDSAVEGMRRNIYSMPPIYTLSQDTLRSILERNGVDEETKERVLHFYAEHVARTKKILMHSTIHDEIGFLTKEEFHQYPLYLPYLQSFATKPVEYTYEDYLQHLNDTDDFCKCHENYQYELSATVAFRNLQISMHPKKWALISKNKAPSIHFLVFHPKLRQAIEGL